MTYRSLAMAALAALCLSACGGGGGGRSGPPGMDSTRPMPDPRPTAAQAIEQIGNIGRMADGLTTTDIVVTPGSRLLANLRIDTDCGGTSCIAEGETGSFSTSVDADALSQIPEATVTVADNLYGVHRGRIDDQIEVEMISADFLAYGAWLEQQFFGVIQATWSGTVEGARIDGLETVYGFSIGDESGSNPMQGSATWDGLMIGVHVDQPTEEVTGRTQATYSFAEQTMDVQMTNLTRGHADMSWEDLRVSQGRFSAGSDADSIAGSFYGDTHQEVGGVFERNQLIGAFGAKRK